MREDRLEKGLSVLGLRLEKAQIMTLYAYLQMIKKWSRCYNLTAIRDPAEMISKHLLDSLSIWPYPQGQRILDMGSGAGLPGIPLAVIYPNCQFVLLDSSAKKTRFLVQASIELGLSNLAVVSERAQAYRPPLLFDTVITRAFAKLADFATLAGPLCKPGGSLLAMKGAFPREEIEALSTAFRVIAVHALSVPGIHAQRHLVRIKTEQGRRALDGLYFRHY